MSRLNHTLRVDTQRPALCRSYNSLQSLRPIDSPPPQDDPFSSRLSPSSTLADSSFLSCSSSSASSALHPAPSASFSPPSPPSHLRPTSDGNLRDDGLLHPDIPSIPALRPHTDHDLACSSCEHGHFLVLGYTATLSAQRPLGSIDPGKVLLRAGGSEIYVCSEKTTPSGYEPARGARPQPSGPQDASEAISSTPDKAHDRLGLSPDAIDRVSSAPHATTHAQNSSQLAPSLDATGLCRPNRQPVAYSFMRYQLEFNHKDRWLPKLLNRLRHHWPSLHSLPSSQTIARRPPKGDADADGDGDDDCVVLAEGTELRQYGRARDPRRSMAAFSRISIDILPSVHTHGKKGRHADELVEAPHGRMFKKPFTVSSKHDEHHPDRLSSRKHILRPLSRIASPSHQANKGARDTDTQPSLTYPPETSAPPAYRANWIAIKSTSSNRVYVECLHPSQDGFLAPPKHRSNDTEPSPLLPPQSHWDLWQFGSEPGPGIDFVIPGAFVVVRGRGIQSVQSAGHPLPFHILTRRGTPGREARLFSGCFDSGGRLYLGSKSERWAVSGRSNPSHSTKGHPNLSGRLAGNESRDPHENEHTGSSDASGDGDDVIGMDGFAEVPCYHFKPNPQSCCDPPSSQSVPVRRSFYTPAESHDPQLPPGKWYKISVKGSAYEIRSPIDGDVLPNATLRRSRVRPSRALSRLFSYPSRSSILSLSPTNSGEIDLEYTPGHPRADIAETEPPTAVGSASLSSHLDFAETDEPTGYAPPNHDDSIYRIPRYQSPNLDHAQEQHASPLQGDDSEPLNYLENNPYIASEESPDGNLLTDGSIIICGSLSLLWRCPGGHCSPADHKYRTADAGGYRNTVTGRHTNEHGCSEESRSCSDPPSTLGRSTFDPPGVTQQHGSSPNHSPDPGFDTSSKSMHDAANPLQPGFARYFPIPISHFYPPAASLDSLEGSKPQPWPTLRNVPSSAPSGTSFSSGSEDKLDMTARLHGWHEKYTCPVTLDDINVEHLDRSVYNLDMYDADNAESKLLLRWSRRFARENVFSNLRTRSSRLLRLSPRSNETLQVSDKADPTESSRTPIQQHDATRGIYGDSADVEQYDHRDSPVPFDGPAAGHAPDTQSPRGQLSSRRSKRDMRWIRDMVCSSRFDDEAAGERLKLGRPWVFISCGHIVSYFYDKLDVLPTACVVCRRDSDLLPLTSRICPEITTNDWTHCLNPCGHLLDQRAAEYWGKQVLFPIWSQRPNKSESLRWAHKCPFCQVEIRDVVKIYGQKDDL
ncbi:uncharacterized protein BJ171DRAFT_178671 [Polychytrium aggregatum]|uniref:uncharacterized protein n=1 Tax=Polychytrium aggregatum TaxID=110093 RepID=UPI0022FF3C69|nr:uncharacterized protein BJ171DRAFT_178671 [Polychytrium aggregatum]KAI9202608.1 hypothetical protein BJ171DRAFT_178671 [Polychytrium aggregatum]